MCTYFTISCYKNCILKAESFWCWTKVESTLRMLDRSEVYIITYKEKGE